MCAVVAWVDWASTCLGTVIAYFIPFIPNPFELVTGLLTVFNPGLLLILPSWLNYAVLLWPRPELQGMLTLGDVNPRLSLTLFCVLKPTPPLWSSMPVPVFPWLPRNPPRFYECASEEVEFWELRKKEFFAELVPLGTWAALALVCCGNLRFMFADGVFASLVSIIWD